MFEIKNALDSASKKRAKGIIEHAAEETKCKVMQRPIGEEQVKNKSMLLTVSGTTEKVVAAKTLVKMRIAQEARKREPSQLGHRDQEPERSRRSSPGSAYHQSTY